MSTKKTNVNGPAPKAKKAETKTAKAAGKPKHKPRTEEQKKARRERDAKRRALAAAKKPAEKKAGRDASGSKASVKCMFEVGGINNNVADLFCCVMSRVFERVSTEVKNLLNAFDDVMSDAKKK